MFVDGIATLHEQAANHVLALEREAEAKMMGVIDWLKGKKTYLVAAGGAISGAVLLLEGHVVEGVQTILGALGLGALRAGVKKAENNKA